MVSLTGSISQNTGVSPFRIIASVVDRKVNGVVITSPCNPKDCRASSKAICPFEKSKKCSASNSFCSRAVSSSCSFPILVSHLLFPILCIASTYSSMGGIEDCVTKIVSLFFSISVTRLTAGNNAFLRYSHIYQITFHFFCKK